MIVAKLTDQRGRPQFREVVRVGRVQFDSRDGWVLLRFPLGERPRKLEYQWAHPSEVRFEWVREFRFDRKEQP